MPLPYTFDSEHRVVRVRLEGRITGPLIADAISAIYRDPRWQKGFDILWNARGITELLFEAEDQPGFVELQRTMAALAGGGRDVILVSRPIDAAMAAAYKHMARAVKEVHVVRTEQEVRTILGWSSDVPIDY